MKRTLAILLLAVGCHPSPSWADTIPIQGPEKLPTKTPFALLKASIPAAVGDHYWWEITPQAQTLETVERDGTKALLILSPANGVYTIRVTGQEPVDGLDPLHRGVHTLTVGDGPEPEPPGPEPKPTPDPPTDPIARKVFDAAIKHKLNPKECREVAKNIRAVLGGGSATSMTVEEIQADIKGRNEPITKDKPEWDAWEKELPGLFNVSSKNEVIAAYNAIQEGLDAIR